MGEMRKPMRLRTTQTVQFAMHFDAKRPSDVLGICIFRTIGDTVPIMRDTSWNFVRKVLTKLLDPLRRHA